MNRQAIRECFDSVLILILSALCGAGAVIIDVQRTEREDAKRRSAPSVIRNIDSEPFPRSITL